jgi:hypothetical protein
MTATFPFLTQSVSHVTTDGQSVSPSWCRAPFGAHDQILINIWQLLFFNVGRPPPTPDEKSGLTFVLGRTYIGHRYVPVRSDTAA